MFFFCFFLHFKKFPRTLLDMQFIYLQIFYLSIFLDTYGQLSDTELNDWVKKSKTIDPVNAVESDGVNINMKSNNNLFFDSTKIQLPVSMADAGSQLKEKKTFKLKIHDPKLKMKHDQEMRNRVEQSEKTELLENFIDQRSKLILRVVVLIVLIIGVVYWFEVRSVRRPDRDRKNFEESVPLTKIEK